MDATFERGRFFIGPNGFPRFAGSSSGVYLADTIRAQLSTRPETGQQVVTEGTTDSEIEQAFISRHNEQSADGSDSLGYWQYSLKTADLRQDETLRACITKYFEIWHPLFPFLDGAYLIRCFDDAVNMAQLEAMMSASVPTGSMAFNNSAASAFTGLSSHEALVLSAVFLAVWSLGGLELEKTRGPGPETGMPEHGTPQFPRITSPSHASTLAHLVLGAAQEGKVNDMFALQAILALQLFLYATRALRPAMHLSGILTKLACEAGLHRCPERYRNTFVSPTDRKLRKRVFHSFYTLDRILSAEFGMPIMLSDTDIDTCLPGDVEKHDEGESTALHPARTPVDEVTLLAAGSVTSSRKRRRLEEEASTEPAKQGSTSPASSGKDIRDPRASAALAPDQDDEADMKRLAAANAIIQMAKMTGRAMELFNKSLRHRSLNPQEALRLRTDLDQWWNDLGLDSEESTSSDPRIRNSTLFTCLYHQQVINLNRPALSLSPGQTQHAYALQSTIASVRTVISILSKDVAAGSSCFWPGYVDMVFFGCLILVYGAKQNKDARDSQTRLHIDLQRALKLLQHFEKRWRHLRSFLKIVQSFISQVDPDAAVHQSGSHTPSQWAPAVPPPAFDFDQHFNELLAGDFHFDFNTFALDPENTWAYHMSVPASPLL